MAYNTNAIPTKKKGPTVIIKQGKPYDLGNVIRVKK